MTTIPTRQPVRFKPARPYLVQVARDTFGRWGARLGVAWVATLILLAIFAPFIANSHPILLQQNGQWSSPMLKHLVSVDVILIMGFMSFLILLPIRFISVKARIWSWIVLMIIVSGLAIQFVNPPINIIYSKYREATAKGDIEKAYYTLIPFSPTDRMSDLGDHRLKAPSSRHWMGTTLDGYNMASRMIHGTRIALSIGLLSTGIAVIIGITVGGLMGYFSGIVDLIGMRFVEIFSAIPTIYLLIAVTAFYEHRSIYLMMTILGLTSWVGYATFVRAEFFKIRQQDYVMAAKAAGLPLWSIIFKHMLPNGVTPVIVSASFGIAGAILTESTLSFLGLGLTEDPSWGQLLDEARTGGAIYWWIAVYPGLAIFFTVFAYNLIGEALRDAIDPHLQKAAQL